MEETFYKKILVSSGEVPEEEGFYDTNTGWRNYNNLLWFQGSIIRPDFIIDIEYWLKPVPSPKQEAIEFAEWVSKNYIRLGKDKYVHCYCNPKEMFNMALTMDKLHSIFVKSEKGEK